MNDKAPRSVATTNHPPCPPWCFHHRDDIDLVATPPSPARYHHGPIRRVVAHTDPLAVLHLELSRSDFDHQAGEPGVKLTLIESDGTVVGDLLPGPMPIEGCREFVTELSELLDVVEPRPAIPAQRTNVASGLRTFLLAEAVAR